MNFIDALIVCFKKKWVLICVPMISAFLTIVIVSFFPKYYYTEIRLRIDDPNGSSLNIFEGLNKNLGSYFGKNQQNESHELFLELLTGRENLVAAIKKFQLDSLYKKKSIDLTIKSLLNDLNMEICDNRIITCGYTSKNIKLSIQLVTFLVNNTNERYSKLQKERFSLNNLFLNQKHKQLIDSLEHFNKQLINFYKDNNIINLEKQIEISLLALSNYEQQYKSFQFEKKLIDLNSKKGSPESKKIEDILNVLKHEFQALRIKDTSSTYQPKRNSLFLNTDWGIEQLLYERITLSKIEILKDFIGALTKEIALTESNLTRDIPVAQIVQEAFVPDWKVKPKRTKWALSVFISSLLLCVCYFILKAYIDGEIKGDEVIRNRIKEMLSALKS